MGPKTFLPRQKLVSTATALVAKTSEHALTIADGSVTSASIQADSVTSTQIAENAVGASEIAPGSISSSNLTENSVQLNHAGIGVAAPYFTKQRPTLWINGDNNTFHGGYFTTRILYEFDCGTFGPTKDLIPTGARGLILKVFVHDGHSDSSSAIFFGNEDPDDPFGGADIHANIGVDNYQTTGWVVDTIFVPFKRGTKIIRFKVGRPFDDQTHNPIYSRASFLGYY